MRTFKQLTPDEQEQAIQYQESSLLQATLDGSIRFNDTLNQDNLQKKIDEAIQKAEDMKTPWFAHEYIMDTCSEDIRALAIPAAEDAIYLDDDEPEAVRFRQDGSLVFRA